MSRKKSEKPELSRRLRAGFNMGLTATLFLIIAIVAILAILDDAGISLGF